MKKNLCLLTALILLAALLPVSAAINVPSTAMYVKTGNGKSLNLRAEADANALVITNIPYGAQVSVYSDFLGMVWYHVQYGMHQGYVKTEFLVSNPPKPFVTPSPKPTVRPTATPKPSPEEVTARELAAAAKLGLVPKGMTTSGNCTWQELDALLTNVVRLHTKNASAVRTHVYLSLAEYQAAHAGAEFNIVLRGVAAGELYGALMDMGESDPVSTHNNDPFLLDAADIQLSQEYAGINASSGGWRELPLYSMVVIILDHVDSLSGLPVMTLDMDSAFRPTHPLTRAEAILATYRLFNSFSHFKGRVTVTHARQANLRAEPSMKAAIVGKVNPGEVYNVLSVPYKGWYQIQLPSGQAHYISAGMVAYEVN